MEWKQMPSEDKTGLCIAIVTIVAFIFTAGFQVGGCVTRTRPIDKTIAVFVADQATHKIIDIIGSVNIRDKTESIIVEIPMPKKVDMEEENVTSVTQ
jgi:uncharacterized membrane protein